MPNYIFNIRTASHIGDAVTVQMDDHTALRTEMARFVGKLLSDHAEVIWVDEDWQFDVTDESGLILYAMNISAMKTAATMNKRP
ncbi:DUF6894 family protein [Sphingobium sp. LSP13-1-1.1]|uniref:DUF6894 family protein n=1 Tax=Sphingobium sp. LSP13-1-1.1 TaxID=3135234 RepID=UPI00343F51FB